MSTARNTRRGFPRVSPEDRIFFERFGVRISALRKDRGLTQMELAKRVGCSQQRVVSFEKGQRRMPLTELVRFADALEVSVEDLLGRLGKPSKRGPPSRLEQQLERLSKLPRRDQRVVAEMLEGFLQRAGQAA